MDRGGLQYWNQALVTLPTCLAASRSKGEAGQRFPEANDGTGSVSTTVTLI